MLSEQQETDLSVNGILHLIELRCAHLTDHSHCFRVCCLKVRGYVTDQEIQGNNSAHIRNVQLYKPSESSFHNIILQ